MAFQPAPEFLDYGEGVPATSRLHVQVQMQSGFLTATSEESCKGSLALPLHTNEYDTSGFDLDTAAHRRSAELRNTAEHPRPILGIETGVATETAHVLCAVHTSCAAGVFLNDEDLLLLEIV